MTGVAPVHRVDSKVFETKFGQEHKNQFAGNKGGEAWKVLMRGYLLGRVPVMKYLLEWAADFGVT